MYLTGDDGYQIFLVFTAILNSVTSDNNKKLLTRYQLEYHLKKLNHFILILHQP